MEMRINDIKTEDYIMSTTMRSEKTTCQEFATVIPPKNTAMGQESLGAIFTKREVVNFILDLVGYTDEHPLYSKRLLEPSFGGGDFLLPIIERLLSSWRGAGQPGITVLSLSDAILAVELNYDTYIKTREAVVSLLVSEGFSVDMSTSLVDCWLIQDDFLITKIDGQFDFVVGNPPYVRQELISPLLLAEYRKRYKTIYDRADLYIPFVERSLLTLRTGGTLGFICSDRWMKNRYGGPLRNLISEQFYVKIYVDMVDSSAFYSDVIAYPAVTIISRDTPRMTRVSHSSSVDEVSLGSLTRALQSERLPQGDATVYEIGKLTNGSEPWLLGSADQLALLRRLEAAYPCLEDARCRVGIGVATGADKAFIADYAGLDVETDRKVPLVTTRDILTGNVRWRGLGVINPFLDNGKLVDLAYYPRLKRYLESNRDLIAGRHCARKAPAKWYRTIDRIYPHILFEPKLLIPDIKGEANVVYEDGGLYPHHNLYYVTSSEWDLRALQAVLLSVVTRLFISAYSVKMHGGCLRFQAQYLRRVRIPLWSGVPELLRFELANAAMARDIDACNQAVFRLYNLTIDEQSALGGNGGM